MQVGIALGSNLGDSEALLKQAIENLKKIHNKSSNLFLVSDFYETIPLDCPPHSPLFINAVVLLETDLPPLDLLKELQALERATGRFFPYPKHAPRTLDLDLLYYDTLILDTPELKLPHPRAYQRSFVLKPLAQIAPSLKLPYWEKTALEYLNALEQSITS